MAQGQLRGQLSVPAPEQVATALPASARYSWLSALRSQWAEAPSHSRSQCPHLCIASLVAHIGQLPTATSLSVYPQPRLSLARAPPPPLHPLWPIPLPTTLDSTGAGLWCFTYPPTPLLIATAFPGAATFSCPPPGWPPCCPYLTPQALMFPQGRARLQGLVSELPHTGPACLSVLSLPTPRSPAPSGHSPLLLTNPAHAKPWPFACWIPASKKLPAPA